MEMKIQMLLMLVMTTTLIRLRRVVLYSVYNIQPIVDEFFSSG